MRTKSPTKRSHEMTDVHENMTWTMKMTEKRRADCHAWNLT
jgi:hypothetical protein